MRTIIEVLKNLRISATNQVNNNQETFISDKSRDTNRSESNLRRIPVGKNQYLAAGFQRTISKVIIQLCSGTA